jgi:hypothetical protein
MITNLSTEELLETQTYIEYRISELLKIDSKIDEEKKQQDIKFFNNLLNLAGKELLSRI